MEAQQQQISFPRPQRGVKALLVIYSVIALVGAISFNYLATNFVWKWLAFNPTAGVRQIYGLLTAGLLTDPKHWSQIIFTLIALYFLGPDLERRWGMWRFLRFTSLSIIAGFALSLLLRVISPPEATVFHLDMMYGPTAAMSALAVAWGRENAGAQIRLFFFLPITGKLLVWITLGFCVLGVFFPASVTEGVASPFGGFIVGLLLSGAPSPIRTLYLRVKLFFLRRRGPAVNIDLDPITRPRVTAKKRAGSPPLRVVVGGLDEDLEKRRPPKDKRYLN